MGKEKNEDMMVKTKAIHEEVDFQQSALMDSYIKQIALWAEVMPYKKERWIQKHGAAKVFQSVSSMHRWLDHGMEDLGV